LIVTRATPAAISYNTSVDINSGSYSHTIHLVLVYAIAVVAALAIPLLTRGSYSRMLEVRWRWGSLLFAGVAIQVFLEFVDIPKEHWHDVGFGLLVASYVLILAFVARNLVLRGMGIVFIGIACNALVITLNQGMPVKFPAEWQNKPWATPTVKHHPQQPDEQLLFLSDIIVLKGPLESIVSFGDLILAVGLCDVAYNASRKPKPRRPKSKSKPRTPNSRPKPKRAKKNNKSRPSGAIDLQDHDEPPNAQETLTRSRSTRSSAMTTRSS
jgi:hypothetical protein